MEACKRFAVDEAATVLCHGEPPNPTDEEPQISGFSASPSLSVSLAFSLPQSGFQASQRAVVSTQMRLFICTLKFWVHHQNVILLSIVLGK